MSVASDIAKATGLFQQGVDLMDSTNSMGGLAVVQNTVQDNMFELLGVEGVLPPSVPKVAHRVETARRGNAYLDVFGAEATG